jgi:hypothetical protein
MAFTIRTSEFRNIVQEKVASLPPAKRRKVALTGARRHAKGQDPFEKQYMGEAYTIVSALSVMLASFLLI